MMPFLFIKQLGLSETGGLLLLSTRSLHFSHGGEGAGEGGEGGEVSVSRRRADEGEVRLTGMSFVAPLKRPFAPRDTAAVMFGTAESGGKGGAGREGGGGQQSA